MTSQNAATTVELGLPELLERLQQLPREQAVLSVYLDISPRRLDREALLLAYRDLIREMRDSLPAGDALTFDGAAARIEAYLTDRFEWRGQSLAAFASAQSDALYVGQLPRRAGDLAVWDAEPHTAPLLAILDDEERVALVLFDSAHARLFTVYLGEIERRTEITDRVPPRQKTGGWAALSQSRFARHREERIRLHAHRAVAALTTMLREQPFDRLFLAGPDEAVALLRRSLTRPLQARLAGTLRLPLTAGDAAILAAVHEAAQASERKHELEMVNELIEEASGGPEADAVLGADAVLETLAQRPISQLYVAASLQRSGMECPSCGRLAAAAATCPDCGTAMVPRADLIDPLIRQAVRRGATVEVVSGEAERLLLLHGGLGAWRR
jgi:peptide chain release factor subunit 1